jgi:cell wall-associated NlpC family hydrolase
MPLIQANRDAIDDRFNVLGFTVRTESPLFEVAVATDPSLFRPENRARRARANFYSSRGQGVIRARRGEAVYLLPSEVLGNFVGQPRLYFGLATYRDASRGVPDFVHAPDEGSMYVGMGQLTERGLRRSGQAQTGSSYATGSGRDPSLDWGGDAQAQSRSAISNAVGGAVSPAAKPIAEPVVAAAGYDDGFGAFPVAQAQETEHASAQGIPLDPGAGGRSIGLEPLAVGDVIVSTTRDFISRIIRLGTLSPVSHVMLYVGNGRVIEAVGHGVRETTLGEAISDAILAVAYRVPGLNAAGAAQVVAHARSRLGSPYNFAGVAYQGYSILNPLDSAVLQAIGDRLGVEAGQAGAVYCSELVLESFERTGHPLGTRPAQSTPNGIAQLARSRWSYVGHLKAENVPMGIQLELQDAPEQAASWTLQVPTPPRIRVPNRQRRAARFPSTRLLSNLESTLLNAALFALNPVLGTTLAALRLLPKSNQVSVAIGPSASAGFMLGGGVGAGIIFTSDGKVGIYGQFDIRQGFIDSASIEMQVTIVHGGIEAFAGIGFAVVVEVDAGVSISAQALFNTSAQYQGITMGLGVGLGVEPLQIYLAMQGSAPQALALSLEAQPQALALASPGSSADPGGQNLPSPPADVIEQPTEAQPALVRAQVGPQVVAIAEVVGGAAFTRLLDNSGDVDWELDQMNGLKHPNDVAPSQMPAFRDGPAISLVDWPSLGWIDKICAGFQIRWQYNGQSLGNVQISSLTSNDAVGMGLTVKARIIDDSIVYPRNAPSFAALRVRFEYRFTQVVGPDHLAFHEVHLFGNGAHNKHGDWTQHSFL